MFWYISRLFSMEEFGRKIYQEHFWWKCSLPKIHCSADNRLVGNSQSATKGLNQRPGTSQKGMEKGSCGPDYRTTLKLTKCSFLNLNCYGGPEDQYWCCYGNYTNCESYSWTQLRKLQQCVQIIESILQLLLLSMCGAPSIWYHYILTKK